MFKKWIKRAQQVQKNQQQALLERLDEFEDPLAKNIEWSPLKGGGTNFKTHTLVSEFNRLQYKASNGAILFGSVFSILGAGIPAFMIYGNIQSGAPILDGTNLFSLVFGIVFLLVGFFILKRFTTPITFDKNLGLYWRGKKEPARYYAGSNTSDKIVKLADVHALQIVAERVKGDNRSYFSFELNLVTKSGRRFNIIDHGDRYAIQKDARLISEFLEVPVWNLNSNN